MKEAREGRVGRLFEDGHVAGMNRWGEATRRWTEGKEKKVD